MAEVWPADAVRFLARMAGIRAQQLSAATGAVAVRLEGLKPRYSLLLVDGLPRHGGGGTGFDLLQMTPADLDQIELVKGPASALFGASALGGAVNLISGRPRNESDYLLQATSRGGVSAFARSSSGITDGFGFAVVSGLHKQGATDVDGDGWGDLPGVRRAEVRPRLYFEWPAGHSLLLSVGATAEKREGGIIPGQLAPDGLPFRESVKTTRADLGMVAHRRVGHSGFVSWRAATNVDKKNKVFDGAAEDVTRSMLFTELSYANRAGTHEWMGGAAAEIDAAKLPQFAGNEYTFSTVSAFAQDAWTLAPAWSITASARADQHNRYGLNFSERLSLRHEISRAWEARLIASHGYFGPSPFVEEAEAVGVRRVRGFNGLDVETADYAAFDLHGRRGRIEFTATAFASRTRHPVAVAPDTLAGTIVLSNALTDATSHGAELFGVYDRGPVSITAVYTLTLAREPVSAASADSRSSPYVPRHAGGVDIAWENVAQRTRVAVEATYTGSQPLDRDPYLSRGAAYAVIGLLVSQRIGRYKVFVNLENATDVQQTAYAPLLLPARRTTGELTTSVWAPLEGRILSVGMRISSGELIPH